MSLLLAFWSACQRESTMSTALSLAGDFGSSKRVKEGQEGPVENQNFFLLRIRVFFFGGSGSHHRRSDRKDLQ